MIRPRLVGFFPFLTLALLLGPVLAGLWGTVLPAFGHLPAAGHMGPSVLPFQTLFDWSGFLPSLLLTLRTGSIATILSVTIAFLILSAGSESAGFTRIRRLLSPLLSVPHAAAAFGLAFLIAPSGWLIRVLSPWATGWDKPPDIAIVQDAAGFAMIAGLVAKEVPFLFLMGLAALDQSRQTQSMMIARALGYGQTTGWAKAVLPSVYRQMRLPIFAVLAYSLSAVDTALILGPNTPPPLSVQILHWMNSPVIENRLVASAAALVQLGLVLGSIAIWISTETLFSTLLRAWVLAGSRWPAGAWLSRLGTVAGQGIAVVLLAGLAILLLWSFAGLWVFPNTLPDSFSFLTWLRQGPEIRNAFGATATVAGIASCVAVLLVIGCLQAEAKSDIWTGKSLTRNALWLIYLPLLVPQTAFLPGLQTLLIGAGFATGFGPVIFAHLVFVLPYVFLSLADPFREWDPRYGAVGAALGKSQDRVLFLLRLPMLFRPILTATAVGLSVSVGQYLPTLLIGGGRVSTLTTEALALASGGDRKVIGAWALGQTIAALLPFAAATLLPQWVWRNRKGML